MALSQDRDLLWTLKKNEKLVMEEDLDFELDHNVYHRYVAKERYISRYRKIKPKASRQILMFVGMSAELLIGFCNAKDLCLKRPPNHELGL